jgi:hypothetical protein
MISRKTVKSNASSVHPSHAAMNAYHWSLVGSFHHGTDGLLPAAAEIDGNSLFIVRIFGPVAIVSA